jgi:ankyrin repeat protein
MAGATHDERLVALLLERGADPNSANAHGWTSLHQAGYSGLAPLARMLLAAGAQPDLFARGDGGTPLIVALFWGHRDVAEVLAEQGIHPRNLRAAAGLGRVELIDELAGTPLAGAHRGFYRPHGGFPAWEPTDDPQEVLDEALAWAARSDRIDAIDALLRHGARLEADVYRGTPLMWAAASGRAGAVRRLIERGADPSGRSTFGGPEHGVGVTPLHLAAQSGHLDTIRALLAAGADPNVRDALYDSPPSGWAEFGCQSDAAELLRAHASNEDHATSG